MARSSRRRSVLAWSPIAVLCAVTAAAGWLGAATGAAGVEGTTHGSGGPAALSSQRSQRPHWKVPRSRTPSTVTATSKVPAGAGVRTAAPGTTAAPAPPPPPPLTLPFGRVPTIFEPLRVLTIGDSVLNDAEPAFAAAFGATGVATLSDATIDGFGLSRPIPFTWAQLAAQYHPEIVVGTWSWDTLGATDQPQAYSWELHNTIAEILATGVDDVVLLEFPLVGPRGGVLDSVHLAQIQNQQEANWDAIAASMVAQFPGKVAYLTSDKALYLNGQYSTWLPSLQGWSRARKLDDTHFCPPGAAAWAGATVSEISQMLNLALPAGGWWAGPWRSDPRYNQPAGACPNDQPPPGFDGGY